MSDKLFGKNAPKIRNMPAGADFLSLMAKSLYEELGDELPKTLILLPTRRAARALSEEFLRLNNGKAMLMPKMRPLADINPDEPPFSLALADMEIPPAIEPIKAQFELARLVIEKMKREGEEISATTAISMAKPLANLMAEMAMEEIEPDAFNKIEDMLGLLAEHFNDAYEFTRIISEFWPKFLRENKLMDNMGRRVKLLNEAARLWQQNSPEHPVIVAGSTGTLNATARLIKTISQMPKGLVVLPGLDIYMDDKIWAEIDEQHPQYSLKNLLQTIGIKREYIKTWPDTKQADNQSLRRHILSQALIPANSTTDWPARIKALKQSHKGKNVFRLGLENLGLIQAEGPDEEALCIALIMRKALYNQKTAMLVTPDPSLARRVRVQLSRWDINIDNSAGEPLEETVYGAFTALCLETVNKPDDLVVLAALVKNRLFSLGKVKTKWTEYELAIRKSKKTSDEYEKIIEKIKTGLEPLIKLSKQKHEAKQFALAHAEVLQNLAGDKIWQDNGEKISKLLSDLMHYSDPLGKIDIDDYASMISNLMRGQVVRPHYGTETGLHIYGPLEARMMAADITILGSLNEGVWPAPPAIEPVLSRGMRKKIGLEMPEKRFGLAAHDFENLAARNKVYLTRAKRSDDGPAVMSRWLWRLTTLVRGAFIDDTDNIDVLKPDIDWLKLARSLNLPPDKPKIAKRPAPIVDKEMIWPEHSGGRKLSVTRITKLIRDPYSLYAERVLGLKPLEDLGQELGVAEFGTAIHKALENFVTQNKTTKEELQSLMWKELKNIGYPDYLALRQKMRVEQMSEFVFDWLENKRSEGWQTKLIEQKQTYHLSEINFTLTGKADLILKKNGMFSVIDYKTGGAPTGKIVAAGFDPQLPLLAFLVMKNDKKTKPQGLYYLKLGKQEEIHVDADMSADNLVEMSETNFINLIKSFDKGAPFYSQPRIQYQNDYGDYDHLARRDEWAKMADEKGDKS